jgi:transcriptional regulator with XRE-family HTH domain
MDLTKIGKNIRALRKSKGYTQEKLAAVAECSWRYVQMVEQGRNIPSVRWLNNLAEKTNTPLKYFFGE